MLIQESSRLEEQGASRYTGNKENFRVLDDDHRSDQINQAVAYLKQGGK